MLCSCRRLSVFAVCAATSWLPFASGAIIVQTGWSGGSQDTAQTYFTAAGQSDTLSFDPFDSLGGSRLLTGVSYRVRVVATQDWVADNDSSSPTSVTGMMMRQGEVHLPADLSVYDTGILSAYSDPFPLAADNPPENGLDVNRTPTNQDTTGWQTLPADWGWSTSQTVSAADYGSFIGPANVSVTLDATQFQWGILWDSGSGLSDYQFRNPGLGFGVELTYAYDTLHMPEPAGLLLLAIFGLGGMWLRRPRRLRESR